MENFIKDKRFNNVISNPRFKRIPRNERKVKIDKRFQSMFTDKRFQVKYTVDERGREVNQLQSENYKKYYDLTDSSSDSNAESDIEEKVSTEEENDEGKDEKNNSDISSKPSYSKADLQQNKNISKEKNKSEEISEKVVESESELENKDEVTTEDVSNDQDDLKKQEAKDKVKEVHKEVNKFIDEVHKSKLSGKLREKLTDITVDYARGIGTLVSASESSSDESSSEESDAEQIEHPWGELDKDAEETEDVTHRLAVCNMDWDRVTAKDLMVLFHSFLPSDGIIESITIYPSEFGLARMAEEDLKGPKELVEPTENEEIVPSDEEMEEGSLRQREKLREYQLKRLKYYYAVIACNSEGTANTLYTECDGLEYESSATKLDLRFIADDVMFDQKPHDVCSSLPDLKKYKPRLFINTALQQGKVDLTWDETDRDRTDFTKKVLAGEEVDEEEVNAYLASSSSEGEEEESKDKNKSDDENEDDVEDEGDRIMKYRSLISNLQDLSDKKRGDVEMEVTWGPNSTAKDDTGTQENDSENQSDSSQELNESSEDEVKLKPLRKGKKKKSKKNQDNSKELESDEENDNAELELLLAEDNPEETERKHFSMEAIQKQEKVDNKKKKWRKKFKKGNKYQEEDTFKINTSDSRFSALFSSHHFNIDPADPHFRKTKAMNELISEKQKRRKTETS